MSVFKEKRSPLLLGYDIWVVCREGKRVFYSTWKLVREGAVMCYGYVCDYGEHFQQACLGRGSSFMSPCVYETVLSLLNNVCALGLTLPLFPKKKNCFVVCLCRILHTVKRECTGCRQRAKARVVRSITKTKQQGTRPPIAHLTSPPTPINNHIGPPQKKTWHRHHRPTKILTNDGRNTW